jgi:fucose permease
MLSVLLIIIYLAFISLGLPDTLLGSAWPSMYGLLNVPVSWAGIISMIIAAGTILSSLMSDRLIHKLGTGRITLISVAMTAVALMGFSMSSAFPQLCFWAVPYGLGAGSVDAALNNFVALHYKSRHMSWLHCFWGIGATAGPYIMGYYLRSGQPWTAGYRSVGVIQIALVAILAVSLPLWNKKDTAARGEDRGRNVLSPAKALQLPGAKATLLSFFCYCGLETTAGLWASSYLVLYRGLSVADAARWAAWFYLGITAGRLLSGFVSEHFGDRTMVRIGQALAAAGMLLILLPMGSGAALSGLIMIGLGCAPIYPSLLHETPAFFGPENSQSLMGMQMASAYVGSTFAPPLFGLLTNLTGMRFYPFYLLFFILLMIVLLENRNRKCEGADLHQ